LELGGFVARNVGAQSRIRPCEGFHGSDKANNPVCRQYATGFGCVGVPVNINPLHASSIWACNAPAEESRDLHDKFTAPCKACRRGLLFIALFDKCAGKRLFPVPFVTEW